MAGRRWPRPTYVVRAEFDAPLSFVYRWCTDFTSGDPKLEEEDYERRIIRRSRKEVVYEDLMDSPTGWFWSRHTVSLRPPDRWHSDTVGSHREMSLDYKLSPLPNDRTRLTLTARRRPMGLGTSNVPKSKWEPGVAQSWVVLGKSLEREYRKSRGR